MNKSQETKNPTIELDLTQIREWLWQLTKNKTRQDWELLPENLRIDYHHYTEYENEQIMDNYYQLVKNYLINWGWVQKKLELTTNK